MTQISGIEAARPPLAERDAPAPAEGDFNVLSARFHLLVDKEFLGTLTPEETEELAGLTRWQAEQKSAFYKMALGT